MNKTLSVKLTVALLIIATMPWLAAQITTRTISGTGTDPTGAAIPNAQVTATNTGTNLSRSAQTSEQGAYRIEFLPVGSYNVEINAQGFKKFVRGGLVLEVNVPVRIDSVLQIGGANETVTVTSEAGQVNTENAQIGRTVNNAEITNLPIVNRNVYTLLTLTPGVESSANS